MEKTPLLLNSREEPPGDPSSIVSRLPLLFRFKGTVIIATWWQILLVVIYSAIVVYIHEYVEGIRINFSQALIDILGIVTGLLLAFRTNTAYERYSEGRALWSQMTLNIRDLTRIIWICVKEEGRYSSKSTVEKKSAINLLVGFAVATKHYLREEYSYDFADLKHLISHLPVFHTPSSNVPMSYQEEMDHCTLEVTDLASTMTRRKKHSCVKDPLKARDVVTPTNIPIELSYYIASYIMSVRDKGQCDEATYTLMQTGEVDKL